MQCLLVGAPYHQKKEATVEATFISRHLQRNTGGLLGSPSKESVSLKSYIDLVGYFSDCAATTQYANANSHDSHLLIILRRKVKSQARDHYNIHVRS